MPFIRGDRREKAMVVFVNVALAFVWMLSGIRLITRWSAMNPNIRVDVILFTTFFTLLWLVLVREKRSFISVLMAGAVFVIVFDMVWRVTAHL